MEKMELITILLMALVLVSGCKPISKEIMEGGCKNCFQHKCSVESDYSHSVLTDYKVVRFFGWKEFWLECETHCVSASDSWGYSTWKHTNYMSMVLENKKDKWGFETDERYWKGICKDPRYI